MVSFIKTRPLIVISLKYSNDMGNSLETFVISTLKELAELKISSTFSFHETRYSKWADIFCDVVVVRNVLDFFPFKFRTIYPYKI